MSGEEFVEHEQGPPRPAPLPDLQAELASTAGSRNSPGAGRRAPGSGPRSRVSVTLALARKSALNQSRPSATIQQPAPSLRAPSTAAGPPATFSRMASPSIAAFTNPSSSPTKRGRRSQRASAFRSALEMSAASSGPVRVTVPPIKSCESPGPRRVVALSSSPRALFTARVWCFSTRWIVSS